MNVRCPNCGAVFPADSAAGGNTECPLCLHEFAAESSEETRSGPSRAELEDSETIALSAPGESSLPAAAQPSGNTIALSGQDPFAGGGDPFAAGGSDPFAASSDPFAASSDPFAASSDPFAAGSDGSAASADPFAASATPPRGGGSKGFASQPTPAVEEADTSGGDSVDFEALLSGGGDDPFGSAAPVDDDPFGAPAAAPFAASDADPFGGAADSNPFGGSDDPFGGGGGDPFGSAEADPFGGADPFGAGSNPFAEGAQDTVVLDGGSGSGDSLFGDDGDEDSLFLATPSTSGAMFDEEEEEDGARESFGGAAAPAVAVAIPSAAAAAPTKKGKGGVLAPLLIVGLGIVGADYMEFTDLGIGAPLRSLVAGFSGKADDKKKNVVAASLVKPIELDDSMEAYLLEVARLTKVAKLSPQDLLVRKLLVDRLLDVYERFPGVFDAEPKYQKQLEELAPKVPTPARYAVLQLLATSNLDGLEAKLTGALQTEGVTADDYGVSALGMFDLFRFHRLKYVLEHPGEFNDPGLDPAAMGQPNDRYLALARTWLDKALPLAENAPNRVKFQYYDARLKAMMGDFKGLAETLPALLERYPKHNRLRLILAHALVETNLLGQAATEVRTALERAVETGNKADLALAYRVEAALEAKRGRVEDQLTALNAVLKLRPTDELTTIRTAQLSLKRKHAQECQALLVAGKKAGMQSIAFEVALVDFWLWSNRTEDALEEIKVATKLYPDTIELLFLRGQIEDRQQHFATARDYFATVIEREPKHLRAIVRLAQLQSQAGRHDDSLLTLQSAVKRLGEDEALLEPMADELYTLKRMKESRQMYAKLLSKHPSNKKYLINAARIDMDNGKVDRALRYMRLLRDDGNLDQSGALQMAEALVLKGQHNEASQTIVPFAEKEPNDVAMNTLAGKALLDSGQIDLAKTFLERAHGVAQRQGGNSETLFHYGRLAFKMGRIEQGIARLQLAIKAEPGKPEYRYFLGRELFRIEAKKGSDAEPKGLGNVAVTEMKFLVLHAQRFANLGAPLTYLDDVRRQLGLHYIREKRYDDAIPHLRESVKLHTTHVETLGALGMALFQVNDKDARDILRKVITLSPKDPIAALYLGLIAQQKSNSIDALKWLQRAAKSSRPEVAEAHFQIALIYRERRQVANARKSLKRYLQVAPKDHPFREEAASILEDLR